MDIERYKNLALSKINEGRITKNVKKVIKNEVNKEQNYREGFYDRRNLSNLRDIISDVRINRNKYNFKDTIIDNLERLNYNILRLIPPAYIQPPPPPPPINIPPPPPINIPPPPPPPPPPINIPPPPPPPPINIPPPPPINDGFPPPPPPNLFDNDNQNDDVNPTLPPPPPPFPTPLEPLTRIVTSARENLLDEIRNPKINLRPTPSEPKKPKISEEQFMINTYNKFMANRDKIAMSSDEDEDEDEDDFWD